MTRKQVDAEVQPDLFGVEPSFGRETVRQEKTSDADASSGVKTQNAGVEYADNPDELTREWCSHLLARYHHYSCKTINSNSVSGGARLGKAHALDLPYVSGRTLLHDYLHCPSGQHKRLLLDYTKLVTAMPHNRLRYWVGEPVANATFKPLLLPEARRAEIESLYNDMARGEHPAVDVPNPLPARLKQLLLPVPGGGFISVTPLPSLQVAKDIYDYCSGVKDQRIKLKTELGKLGRKKKGGESQEKQDELVDRLNSLSEIAQIKSLPVGGANSQNIGAAAYCLTRPVVFDNLPRISKEMREAFSIAFNGPRLYFPKILVINYAKFLDKSRNSDSDERHSWTVTKIKAEARYLAKLVGAQVQQAERARQRLSHFKNDIPSPWPYRDGSDRSRRLDGWLIPDLKTIEWRREEASHLAHELRNYSLGENASGETMTLGLGEIDLRRIANTIISGGLL